MIGLRSVGWAWPLAVLLTLLLLDLVVADDEEAGTLELKLKLILYFGALLGGGIATNAFTPAKPKKAPPPPHRPRKRRGVHSIFNEYGALYCRRAYRMDTTTFWKLHALLEPKLSNKTKKRKRKQKKGAKNGVISTPTWLSVALRYFAGGCPDDIAISHPEFA